MDCNSTRIPYRQTGAFSAIAMDYIDQAAALQPFYEAAPTLKGIQQVIDARKKFPTNRALLVQELEKQYIAVDTSDKVRKNIASLLSPDTFTITTAHQNNIFTGPLYFIYKIIHAIKLADYLQASLRNYHFVPVFYMGSEDADLEELNHIQLDDRKLVWDTNQTGAVGRMKVDKGLIRLLDDMAGQLTVLPYGKELLAAYRKFFQEGTSIQDATFLLVNYLFAEFGLIVLLPDKASLKKQMLPVFEDDLFHERASGIVQKTAEELSAAGYKVQANPREINLFYLIGDVRERIVRTKDAWQVVNREEVFSKTSLLRELETHPERFSPNVILRGLYQETILPDIAFIGGGGEIAYWLQLKTLFQHYKVPFPVLVLRNSFLIVEKKWQEKIAKLGFTTEDFFQSSDALINRLVKRDSQNAIGLNGSVEKVEKLYETLHQKASSVDVTLSRHVEALKKQSLNKIKSLENKMLRAEKRKFTDQQRQILAIKARLFPGNGLQERTENLGSYYAKWGNDFIQQLYNASFGMEQEFIVLSEK